MMTLSMHAIIGSKSSSTVPSSLLGLLSNVTETSLPPNGHHVDMSGSILLSLGDDSVDMLAMPLSVKHTQETPLQAQVGGSWF